MVPSLPISPSAERFIAQPPRRGHRMQSMSHPGKRLAFLVASCLLLIPAVNSGLIDPPDLGLRSVVLVALFTTMVLVFASHLLEELRVFEWDERGVRVLIFDRVLDKLRWDEIDLASEPVWSRGILLSSVDRAQQIRVPSKYSGLERFRRELSSRLGERFQTDLALPVPLLERIDLPYVHVSVPKDSVAIWALTFFAFSASVHWGIPFQVHRSFHLPVSLIGGVFFLLQVLRQPYWVRVTEESITVGSLLFRWATPISKIRRVDVRRGSEDDYLEQAVEFVIADKVTRAPIPCHSGIDRILLAAIIQAIRVQSQRRGVELDSIVDSQLLCTSRSGQE